MFSLAMAETEYADGVPVLGWENRLMNDPHVVALIYQIEHGHAVDTVRRSPWITKSQIFA